MPWAMRLLGFQPAPRPLVNHTGQRKKAGQRKKGRAEKKAGQSHGVFKISVSSYNLKIYPLCLCVSVFCTHCDDGITEILGIKMTGGSSVGEDGFEVTGDALAGEF